MVLKNVDSGTVKNHHSNIDEELRRETKTETTGCLINIGTKVPLIKFRVVV